MDSKERAIHEYQIFDPNRREEDGNRALREQLISTKETHENLDAFFDKLGLQDTSVRPPRHQLLFSQFEKRMEKHRGEISNYLSMVNSQR